MSVITQARGRFGSALDRVTWGRWGDFVAHAFVVACVALAWAWGASPSIILVAGGVFVLVLYLFLAAREGARSPLWLTPLSFYFACYAVSLGASAIYMGTLVARDIPVTFSFVVVPASDLAMGYVLFLAGSVALHAGIQATRPSRRTLDDTVAQRRALASRPLFATLVLLWALGLWSIFLPAWVLRLGFAARALQWAPVAVLACLVLERAAWRQALGARAWRLAIAAGTAGLFVASFTSGSKAILMLSFLPVFWLFVADARMRRHLPAVVIALAVLYFIVVAPLVTIGRVTPFEPGESSFRHYVRVEGEILSGRVSIASADQAASVGGFFNRMFDPTPISYLVGEVRDAGHPGGGTMTYAVSGVVPRALWPDKPSVSQGSWFAKYTGFVPRNAYSPLSLGVTATGEWYWNFGVAGMIVGMALIGALIGLLWRLAGSRPSANVIAMLLYVTIVLDMPNMAEAGSMLISLLASFLLFGALLAAAAFAARRPPPHTLASAEVGK
jgi:hypothetical protein